MPKPRPKTSPTDTDLALERRALELRREGHSYQSIADILELPYKTQAYRYWKRAMARHTEDIAPEIRDTEADRLDRLQLAVWANAMKGDVKSVEAVIKIMERRARLFGLDHSAKIAQQMLKIEGDKVRLMALALGRALDSLDLTDEQKEIAANVLFAELKEAENEHVG